MSMHVLIGSQNHKGLNSTYVSLPWLACELWFLSLLQLPVFTECVGALAFADLSGLVSVY